MGKVRILSSRTFLSGYPPGCKQRKPNWKEASRVSRGGKVTCQGNRNRRSQADHRVTPELLPRRRRHPEGAGQHHKGEARLTRFRPPCASRCPELRGLATWSVSSVLGGLTYNRRPWPSEPSLRLPMLMAAFGLLLCPVFIGGFYGLTAAMILTGLTLAPQLTAQNALLDTLVPPHQVSEAFGWITTAIALGNAIGQAASGALIEHSGHETAFCIAVFSVLGSAAAVTASRRSLRPHHKLPRTTTT